MSVDQDSRVGQCAGAPAMRYRMLGFSGARAAAAVPSTAAATAACIILATAAVPCLRVGVRVCGWNFGMCSFFRGRFPFTRFHSHVGAAPLARSLASECATQLSLRRRTHQRPAASHEEGSCGAHRFSERSSSVQRATIRPALPPSAAASSAPRPSGPKPLVASAGLAPSAHSCHSCTHRHPHMSLQPHLATGGRREGGADQPRRLHRHGQRSAVPQQYRHRLLMPLAPLPTRVLQAAVGRGQAVRLGTQAHPRRRAGAQRAEAVGEHHRRNPALLLFR